MHLISATSGQFLGAVINSAYLSERDPDETRESVQPRHGERLVDLSEILKGLASALSPVAASGD